MRPAFTRLDENNYPLLLDLLETCFVDDVREYFELHQRCDPSYEFSQGQVLTTGDRIVSHVQVFRRQMGYGQDSISYGGIGDVATHPDWRNQGLSARLLEQSIAYMDSQHLPLSILFAGRNSHYEKHGWHEIPGTILHADVPADPPRVSRGFVIKPHGETSAGGLHRLYERASVGLIGPERRSLAYMDGQIRWLPFQGDVRCEIFYQLGHPVGYLRTRLDRGELRVMDISAGSDALVRLAVARVFQHAMDAGCRRIQATFANRSRLARTFAEATGADPEPGGHRMMRLNSLRGTLDRIQATLASRLRDPIPRPPFVLQVGDEAVRLDVSSKGVTLGDPTGDEPRVELKPKTFLDLLMGQEGSHRALAGPDGDARSRGALQLLFPETGNVFWPADCF